MVPQHQRRVAVPLRARVQQTSAHAAAEGADAARLDCLRLHHDRFGEEVVRDAEGSHIGSQFAGVEFVRLRVHRCSGQLEPNGRAFLQVHQHVKQRERVFSARKPDEQLVPLPNHAKGPQRLPHTLEHLLGRLGRSDAGGDVRRRRTLACISVRLVICARRGHAEHFHLFDGQRAGAGEIWLLSCCNLQNLVLIPTSCAT
mmetsp:Transcript_36094/g.90128  ORF Transcript_36094/g.90128 Transcript_36094/m.90128 type:complete len:200 (-) Transcript_36094:1745-2344(-)